MRIDSEGKQISISSVHLNRHLLSHVQVPPHPDPPFIYIIVRFEPTFLHTETYEKYLELNHHLHTRASVR